MGCITSTNKPLYALKRDEIFNVSVVRVQANQPIALARHGFLDITSNELIFMAPEQEPVSWGLQYLRRYGLTGNIFSFEVGRRCPNGPGIYTFRCCSAEQFYIKFQRCINLMSVLVDRSNISIHVLGQLENHQPFTNQYLEPTSVELSSTIHTPTALPVSLHNESNDFNLSSQDSIQSASLTTEIIHLPSSVPSYSNICPTPESSNIYMEQPIGINNEHNNNISSNAIIDQSDLIHCKSKRKNLLKSSSLDVPPEECAPILNNTFETQKMYENVYVPKLYSNPQMNCNQYLGRSYANVKFSPKFEALTGQSKPKELHLNADQQQPGLTNAPVVNYIVLDLEQTRPPSQCSKKNEFGSAHSLSGSANIVCSKRNKLPVTALSCGSATIPKGYTISYNSSKIPINKMEYSGSYTRIDFLKTFALMNSSTNHTDFDMENDMEESRITRHSKFVRKSYSISE